MTVPMATDEHAAAPPAPPLLAVEDLSVSFRRADGASTTAVDSASFTLHQGQALAVVGESGSGKSVTALSMLRLLPEPPANVDGGRILLRGRDLLTLDRRQMLGVRGREIAMIFQEPMTSLNPVFTVGQQIMEAVLLHQKTSRAEARALAAAALAEVGIADASKRMDAYPHQFSGGMRQRVMIAMALACRPGLLVADEPTTALDVTVQRQVLDLLGELRRRRGMGLLLITHDLGIVASHADVACVMYAGRVVEFAAVHQVLRTPLHPYTRALLQCRPRLGERRERLSTINQIMADASQFAPLDQGGVPWWPQGHDQEAVARRHHRLVEAAPFHWVRCWREASGASPRPDVPFSPPPLR